MWHFCICLVELSTAESHTIAVIVYFPVVRCVPILDWHVFWWNRDTNTKDENHHVCVRDYHFLLLLDIVFILECFSSFEIVCLPKVLSLKAGSSGLMLLPWLDKVQFQLSMKPVRCKFNHICVNLLHWLEIVRTWWSRSSLEQAFAKK